MEKFNKGKIIEPYETFHWNASPSFFRGTLGGGFLAQSNAMIV